VRNLGSPLFQAFFGTLLPGKAFSVCIKDGKNIDPACKTGVFLREIAKRLITGLEPQIPDLQERIDHIFHKQLFAIAITELTSLLSRRGVYCSKYPNSEFSVTQFDEAEGNIRYRNIKHSWVNGKCKYCGISKDNTVLGGRDESQTLESHAYEWIHTMKPEDIFKMKFDVIISNPPYQLETDGAGKQAKPIYQYFVRQSKKLSPQYMLMITPSRWFAGGMGLDDYRNEMLSDKHIKTIVDYSLSTDCFPGVDIAGGVSYFLWDKSYSGDCEYTYIDGDYTTTQKRNLDEYDIFVRNNNAISIVKKIMVLRSCTPVYDWTATERRPSKCARSSSSPLSARWSIMPRLKRMSLPALRNFSGTRRCVSARHLPPMNLPRRWALSEFWC
jgi:hypothetical protein